MLRSIAAAPVGLRKAIDGLGAIVREHGHDLYSGHLYVFTSRRGDPVKILTWDRGGFVLYYKLDNVREDDLVSRRWSA